MSYSNKTRACLVHSAWALVTILSFVLSWSWPWARPSMSDESVALESRSTSEKLGGSVRESESAGLTENRNQKDESDASAASVASAESLSPDDFESLLRSAFMSGSPVDRSLAFTRILQEMQASRFTVEQAMIARKFMLENGASAEQWRLFDYAWGAGQPEAALAYLNEIPAEYRDTYLSNMIAGLASVNPDMAIGLYESQEPDMQAKIRPSFLDGLVDNDVTLATDYLYDTDDPENHDWRRMDTLAREIEKNSGLDAALEWASGLPEGPLRGNAWSATYAIWATKDAHAAVQSIVQLPQSADRDQAINGFISAHAHQDGERATTWAAEITNPGMRESALIRAGRQYFAQDQAGATQWFPSSGLPQSAWGQLSASNH
jgi:hypothetical protein